MEDQGEEGLDGSSIVSISTHYITASTDLFAIEGRRVSALQIRSATRHLPQTGRIRSSQADFSKTKIIYKPESCARSFAFRDNCFAENPDLRFEWVTESGSPIYEIHTNTTFGSLASCDHRAAKIASKTYQPFSISA